MVKKKNLSNPFSTGGGGTHFESHVQASFVVLMLTGGYAPCLPCLPIVEIKFQGKIDGYDTDDLIVFVENAENKEKRRLLGQIKHTIAITKNNAKFGEVIQAAWNDFNNTNLFAKGKDIIALITGPLSALDEHNVQWLLNQARHTKNVDEFFRNVEQAKFSPPKSSEKLRVFQHHLKIANNGIEVSKDMLYNFLSHFHLLGYDLGNEFGVTLSLLHSHISQFKPQYPQWVWSRVVDIVQTWNQDSGTITSNKLPEDLRDAFTPRFVTEIPKEFIVPKEEQKYDWTQHPDSTYLALAILIGSWNENSKSDIEAVANFLGIGYDTWLQKAREILLRPNSPLALKNGIWEVVNRVELWPLLGSRILDQNLDIFKSLAVNILKEPDTAFELPLGHHYYASIYDMELGFSQVLRKGVAEGLAILSTQTDTCRNCSQGKTEEICKRAIRELFLNADWVLWGSLNSLLPTLAEVSPDDFLDAVEKTLHQKPCPFDDLFTQEGNGIFGRNFLTGLLWALEGLAWDEQYLVRVCIALGELASQDPGGQSANRPFNSLSAILLPWLPQTLASIEKRKVAVRTLLNEKADIAWNLLIKLLPSEHQTSSGSHKPTWRKIIPDDWTMGVTRHEYWQQVSSYAEIAVAVAEQSPNKLSELIDHFDNLPKSNFDQLIQVLSSQTITELPEEQRILLWDHLTKFTNKHRRFADAKWALSEDVLICIDNVSERLAPTKPFNLYQHLFTDRDFDLYEQNGNWEEQQKRLDAKREKAISEIFQINGIESVIQFAESVVSPGQVGLALGVIADSEIEKTLLPHFLDTSENKHKDLISRYIWRRHQINGWEWCDNINKSTWNPKQIGRFLACLPFTKEAWDRASLWLNTSQREYWLRTSANAYQSEGNLSIAVENLIKYDRPYAAIACLDRMRQTNQPINTKQCVQALLSAHSSGEPTYAMDVYQIVELIKFLQSEVSVAREDLFSVEWSYLPILDSHRGVAPQLLENKLANDPEFFCEVIQLVYRSKQEDKPMKEPTDESRAIATNAWRLLHYWRTPPGTEEDNTFNTEHFNHWLQRVKTMCRESGHLEVAMNAIGSVLIHAPNDPNGLWIHRAIASALNDRDAEEMRAGFRTGKYNSRGVHFVDPTGKPEKELAEEFRFKAEDAENAGFQRFAAILRSLANDYEKESNQIIKEHLSDDPAGF